MMRTKNNVAIAAAIEACIRAHLQMPGVQPLQVAALATELDTVGRGHATAVYVAALGLQLLRAIGAYDRAHLDRFVRGSV